MSLDLQRERSGKFENFCRRSGEDFEYFLNKFGPKIKKQDTNMRQAIPVKERLAVTLRFLATGDTFTSLFKSGIVHDCQALNEVMKDEIRVTKIALN
jgi:hypothetical protein